MRGLAARFATACAAFGLVAGTSTACNSILGEQDRYFGDADAEPGSTARATVLGDASLGHGGMVDAASTTDTDSGAVDTDAPDVDAGPFCQTQPPHYLCSDFEEGSLYVDFSADAGAQWNDDTYGLGVAGVVDASPPAPSRNVMRAYMPEQDPDASASGAGLEVDLPLLTTSATLDFDMSLTSPVLTEGDLDIFSFFQVAPDGSHYETSFRLRPTGLNFVNTVLLSNGEGQSTVRVLPVPPVNGWQHVQMIMTRAVAGHVKITLGGTVAVDQDLVTESFTTTDFQLVLGPNGTENVPGVTAFFDNVALDIGQ